MSGRHASLTVAVAAIVLAAQIISVVPSAAATQTTDFFNKPTSLGAMSDEVTVVGVSTDTEAGILDILIDGEWHRGRPTSGEPLSFTGTPSGYFVSRFMNFASTRVDRIDASGAVLSSFTVSATGGEIAYLSDGSFGLVHRPAGSDQRTPGYMRIDSEGGTMVVRELTDPAVAIDAHRDRVWLLLQQADGSTYFESRSLDGDVISQLRPQLTVRDFAVSSSGSIYGIVGAHIVTINETTGAIVTAWRGRDEPTAIDVAPDGSVRTLSRGPGWESYAVDEYDPEGRHLWRRYWGDLTRTVYLPAVRNLD